MYGIRTIYIPLQKTVCVCVCVCVCVIVANYHVKWHKMIHRKYMNIEKWQI